ncbi:MAG: 16S rRNA (guanine(527)-N(7))-methyltransferase RsmG [candidate division WOR-3 bacterium]|nr:16S rRNA (guanine(527)-N(7))-methyltransferase RsmG [candidate division WOR-3 bacterium]MCX7948119.1 16S rRNA (guanine(527)-N(7))-methyltransferase RsmG [candidate division WOR-3 bacterium]MDW8150803.1 16S rRNA (guanine(527)-N(7))-methyltransferase RsmG [candidate division WOR-3 bacterium]
MKKYNKVLSLTSGKLNLDELIEQSIYVEKFIKMNAYILDVGSGNGIVGIPLKIVRDDLKVFLLERSMKKCAFLEIVILSLNLKDIFVINGDYRNLDIDQSFDYILARAVGNYGVLIRNLEKFLKENGKFILFTDFYTENYKIQKENYKNLKITILYRG